MKIPELLQRRRWQGLVVLGIVVAVVASLGGFGRSDTPRPTIGPGESIELGQYKLAVERARVVDIDDRGEPFDDGMLRVMVTTKVTNVSEESTSFGEGLVGVADRSAEIYSNKTDTSTFHPGLKRTVEVSVPVPANRLAVSSGRIDIWLGARTYDWTNLAMSGPAWSVANWAAIVTDVPIDDQRGKS